MCPSVLVFNSLESVLSTLALSPAEITLMVIMTLLVLGSIAIFLEDAVYLYKNTSCPIKRKTLLWSSSAPTVRGPVAAFWEGLRGGRDHFENSSKLSNSVSKVLPASTTVRWGFVV